MLDDFEDYSYLLNDSWFVYALFGTYREFGVGMEYVDVLLYVGMTGHIATRIKYHAKRFQLSSVFARPCVDEREARILEAQLINRLQPPFNIASRDSPIAYIGKAVDLKALGFDVAKYLPQPAPTLMPDDFLRRI